MEWIEQVDRLDHLLHAIGVPMIVRQDAIAEITTILARAGAQRRDRRQLVLDAVARHNGNVRLAAKSEDWSHETFYAELRPKKVKNAAVG